MNYHKFANLFPMMNDVELFALVDDMKATGYDATAPIITLNGEILDGRNRDKAAKLAGVAPVFVEYDGTDPLEFVIRHNLKRRHLTSSQRAAVAVDLEALLALEAKANQRMGFQKIENPVHAAKEAAKRMDTNTQYVVDAKKLKAEQPRVFEQVLAGNLTLIEAKKNIQTEKRTEARAEIAKVGASVKPSDKWNIYHGDISNWKAPRQYDFIITDPPYPREYLPLYEILARRSVEWLKPGGLLVAMCGQSYLDQIYEMMSKHLEYYWTACYLTPGQFTSLRTRNVNTNWKPLLIFQNGKYAGRIFNDVFVSEAGDKSFHVWGQSVSGMNSIISKMCLAGQYILDPFCGAGTTGIAALQNNCLFDGLEKDIKNVEISKARLHDTTTA